MPIELWKLPVPATALISGPDFAVLPQRRCEISFAVEGHDDSALKKTITFESVQAYRVTYMSSLDVNLINTAYGKLVDLGDSPWLIEINQRSAAYFAKIKKAPPTLSHLAICFDDGPCFEIICAGFRPPS